VFVGKGPARFPDCYAHLTAGVSGECLITVTRCENPQCYLLGFPLYRYLHVPTLLPASPPDSSTIAVWVLACVSIYTLYLSITSLYRVLGIFVKLRLYI